MNTAQKFKAFSVSPRLSALPLALLLLLPRFCSAQQNKLLVHLPEQLAAKRGGTVAEKISVSVLPGFHVNSDKPKDEFLIPLKLTWASGPLQAQNIEYPKPEEITVGGQVLTVLTGNFDIQTKFAVPANAPRGTSVMTGKLRYQACNSEMCFRPSSADVQLSVAIQ